MCPVSLGPRVFSGCEAELHGVPHIQVALGSVTVSRHVPALAGGCLTPSQGPAWTLWLPWAAP